MDTTISKQNTPWFYFWELPPNLVALGVLLTIVFTVVCLVFGPMLWLRSEFYRRYPLRSHT